jgi:hypothetical protein
MIRYIIATVSMLTLLVRGVSPSLADDKDQLIGTWKLVSAVSEELATGQKTNIYEEVRLDSSPLVLMEG